MAVAVLSHNNHWCDRASGPHYLSFTILEERKHILFKLKIAFFYFRMDEFNNAMNQIQNTFHNQDGLHFEGHSH